MVTGRVSAFRKEQGFGTITLDDGRDVKFDASACTMVPSEGEAVRLKIAPAKWGGGFKAVHVEPASSAVPAAPRGKSLDEQLAILQGEHLVAALTEQRLAELVGELYGGRAEDATLLAIVDAYYTAEPARAVAEGYLRHDARFGQETSDVLAELAERVPGVHLWRQLEWTKQTLNVELPDGSKRSVEVESLDDVVALANEALAAAGDARRFYPLDTDGDWHAYLALTAARADRIARALPLQLRGR